MTAGQRFPLPAKVAYPLLSMVAAALVWFAVSRVGELPRRAADGGGRGEGVRDPAGDKPGDEYWPDDRAAGGYVPEGQYVTYGQGRPGARPAGGATFPAGLRARGPRGARRPTGAGARDRSRARRSAGPVPRIRGRAGPVIPRPTSGPGRNRRSCPGPMPGSPSRAWPSSGLPASAAGWPGRRPPRPRGRTAGS